MAGAVAELITDSFICPITFEIMNDPVICVDGHSYERSAIKEWFKLGNVESPRTNAPLESTALLSNSGLQKAIQAWFERASTGASKGAESASTTATSEQGEDADGYPDSPSAAGQTKGKKKKKKKKAGGGASQGNEELNDEVFNRSLCCPLTGKPMQDPVVCSNGDSYEKSVIKEQFACGNTESARTGGKLEPGCLIPNIQLRLAIQAWGQQEEASAPVAGQPKVSTPPTSAEGLMSEALRRELDPDLKEKLVAKMKDPQDVLKSGLNPSTLRSLVQHNPAIAIECLLTLAPLRQLNPYLTTLVASGMTLQSLEVVYRLVHNIDVPDKFVRAYVLKCVRACSEMPNKGNRDSAVRLLCVFLATIIRSKKFDVSTCFVELQAFCIEFHAVREAAACHRLLRAVDPAQ